jgi:hypothetical protein
MAADATPVPLSVIFCGLVFALSVIVTIPVRDPAAVGVNVIEIVQLPRAATELPQVLVWAKSPVMVMLPTLKTTDELLLTVTDFAALVIPTATLPNERELLERLALWASAGRAAVIMKTDAKRMKLEATTRRTMFIPLLRD